MVCLCVVFLLCFFFLSLPSGGFFAYDVCVLLLFLSEGWGFLVFLDCCSICGECFLFYL